MLLNEKPSEKRRLIKEILTFITVTFIFSWTISFLTDWGFLHRLAIKQGGTYANMCTLFIRILLMLGPTIGSIVTVRVYRKEALPRWKWCKPKYYLIIPLFSLFVWMVPVFLSSLFHQNGLSLRPTIDIYQWIAIICELTIAWIGGIGEELGWSVFLLSRLSPQVGKIKAILISGVLRGIWHWPIVMGPIYLRVLDGGISKGTFILAAIQYCFFLPVMGILLSSIWGYIWFRTRSIPLMGWTHQTYDAAKDIAAVLFVTFGSPSIIYNLSVTGILLVTALLLIILIRKEQSLA